MRYLAIIFTALVLVSCKDLEIIRYEYQTTTQMGKTVMAVTQDSVIVTFNGRGEPSHWSRAIKDGEWDAITAAMNGVKLDKVSTLEAPSNKRATDAAPYAKFNFVGKDTTITSSDFDGQSPHEMLIPLMKEFKNIEKQNEY